ncbi:MAG: methyltransferase domain-containing protein [Anaerolineales bacterium]|nr:methyltransferase domain-containing protein [Anaerolineales bacterium]
MTKERPICDYEGSDYQERFWEHGERAYEDEVEAVALKRLVPPSGKRMLEIGAGAGRNTPRFGGFKEVVLLDYAKSQLAQAQSRLGKTDRFHYVMADAYHLPFAPGVFDAATMIRTLHHMADPKSVIRQVRGVMSSGGTYVMEFANKRNVKAIARWFLRRQNWNPFDRTAIEFAPLNFDFHPAAVSEWMVEADFRIEQQLTVSHFRLGLFKRIIPLQVLVGLDSLLQWTGNWWQLSPSVFIQAKAVGEGSRSEVGAFWRCPVCESLELEEGDEGVHCQGCGRTWPVQDGIYNFREPLGTNET